MFGRGRWLTVLVVVLAASIAAYFILKPLVVGAALPLLEDWGLSIEIGTGDESSAPANIRGAGDWRLSKLQDSLEQTTTGAMLFLPASRVLVNGIDVSVTDALFTVFGVSSALVATCDIGNAEQIEVRVLWPQYTDGSIKYRFDSESIRTVTWEVNEGQVLEAKILLPEQIFQAGYDRFTMQQTDADVSVIFNLDGSERAFSRLMSACAA